MSEPSPDRDASEPAAAARSAAVEELVFQGLELLEAGAERALEALLAAHPDEAALVRSRLEGLRRAGLVGSESSGPPERLGDFRLLEPLGGGGMGIVYRAFQESLGREVALKLIRPEQHWFPGARERFQREVEAVARLHHPGIVPVFTVGEEQGIPYLAMERVRGCTLADALELLIEREPSTLTGRDLAQAVSVAAGEEEAAELAPLFRGSWCDAVLRIVRELAEALEHAHRLGVLHRDLKPSNVMITPAGRVMLLDFGLSTFEGADRTTRTGATVGSLPYLPPEIVAREVEAFDRRGDVYELGVTLYELLALELPFALSNPVELAQGIVAARPRPLRKRNPAVPPEAATVCAVAMEREPDRRYASAEDLARDLTNVLERRPIAARETPLGRRARRWVQRHPGGTLALALLLVSVTVGPTLFAWQSHRAAQRLAREYGRSQAFLGKTLDAVQDMLVTLGAEDTRDVPHLERKRRVLLERGLEVYEELALLTAGEAGDVAEIDTRRMEALRQLGEIQRELGRADEARASWDEVLALLAAQPESQSEPRRLIGAAAAFGLARIASTRGATAESIELCERGLALLGDGASPEVSPAAFAARMRLEHQRAKARHLGGDPARATAELADLLAAVDERLVAGVLDQAEREEAASLVVTLGGIAFQSGDFDAAGSALQRATDELEELLDGTVNLVRIKDELVRAHLNLGQLRRNEGELDAARASFERALELQAELAQSFPGVPARQFEHVNALLALGGLCDFDDAHRAQGRELLERARELLAGLLAEDDSDVDRVAVMGMVLANLGTLRMHQAEAARAVGDERAHDQHLEAAHELYPEAVAWQERALALRPADPELSRALRRAHLGQADVWLSDGHHAEAMDAVQRASETGREDWRDLRMIAGRALLAAELAAADEELPEDDRGFLAEAFRADGLALLERAVDAGYADLDDLDGAERLAALRARPEFAALRARVAAAAAAAPPPLR